MNVLVEKIKERSICVLYVHKHQPSVNLRIEVEKRGAE